MDTSGGEMRCVRRSAAADVFLRWENEDTTVVREDEVGWKCWKHPSQPRNGICPSCLRDRLLRLCQHCANVRPCRCSASSSSSSSFSSLSSAELARSSSIATRSDGAGIGAVGTISRLIESEPAFRRSRSAGFQLLRSRSSASAVRDPAAQPSMPRASKAWGPFWRFRRAASGRQEITAGKLYRSRSVAAARSPDAGSGREDGGRRKGLMCYFSSPIKALRNRKSTAKLVLMQDALRCGAGERVRSGDAVTIERAAASVSVATTHVPPSSG